MSTVAFCEQRFIKRVNSWWSAVVSITWHHDQISENQAKGTPGVINAAQANLNVLIMSQVSQLIMIINVNTELYQQFVISIHMTYSHTLFKKYIKHDSIFKKGIP